MNRVTHPYADLCNFRSYSYLATIDTIMKDIFLFET